jgi:hypothetical protein
MSDESFDHHGLLPPLAAAPREFDSWSRERLLVEQRESTPTGPLYHYTRDASLRAILGGQQLRHFSHLHQSDKTEFEYALAIARRVIQDIGASDDFFTRHFCACLDDMLEVNSLAGPFEFYLFSYSRHRDHGPQWLAYGDGGRGVAVGFAASLFQPNKDDLYEEANRNLHIGRVLYGDEATVARHRLTIEHAAEITSRIGQAHVGAVREAPPSHYFAAMARELLASQLVWNCLTAKHECYADEREVRGIIMNVKAKFDPWRRTHDGRQYVEHTLEMKAPGAISEIIVGPLAPASAEEDLLSFLREQDYPAIAVVRSTAAL